ncbi:MAG: hypothetical protein R3F11_23975 [Verrucomicrobiales bacterium]
MRRFAAVLLAAVVVGGATGFSLAQNPALEEETLFFGSFYDASQTYRNGTGIWSFPGKNWRWWFQQVVMTNVSPDGLNALYVHSGGGVLHRTEITGQNAAPLFGGPGGTWYPAWSPSGDRFAVFVNNALRVCLPDGTVTDTYQGGINSLPSWSPDGTKIAYMGNIEVEHVGCELFASGTCDDPVIARTIYVLDLETGIASPIHTPRYHSEATGTWTSDNATHTTITTYSDLLENPVWSPGGQWIAARHTESIFQTRPDPTVGLGESMKEVNVVVLPPSGGNLMPVTRDENRFPYDPNSDVINTPLAWSPDGSRLAYSKTGDQAATEDRQGIYIGTRYDPGSRETRILPDTAQWVVLNQAPLGVRIFPEKSRVPEGSEFEVILKFQNRLDVEVTDVRLTGGLAIAGVGGAELVSGPVPSLPVVLQPKQTRELRWVLRATRTGPVTLRATLEGVRGDSSENVASAPAERELRVVPAGDLLIREGTAPESDFAIDDAYQEAPALRQRASAFLRPTDAITYVLKIENDGIEASDFYLRAAETDTEDWTITYTHQGNDITAQALAGWQTPELDPGGSLAVEVAVAPPSDPEVRDSEILLTLLERASDLVPLDSVAIEATTRDVIVVNVTSDEEDADPDDGVIDVDPDEEGEQISIVAAIDFANRRSGRDRIEFDMPSSLIQLAPTERGRRPGGSFSGSELVSPLSTPSRSPTRWKSTDPLSRGGASISPGSSITMTARTGG